jgi:hypothetical protein
MTETEYQGDGPRGDELADVPPPDHDSTPDPSTLGEGSPRGAGGLASEAQDTPAPDDPEELGEGLPRGGEGLAEDA